MYYEDRIQEYNYVVSKKNPYLARADASPDTEVLLFTNIPVSNPHKPCN